MNDFDFDALLKTALGPEERSPDRRFVARVDAAVREEARFRDWRSRILRQLTGETLGLASIVAALLVVSRAPGVRAAVSGAGEIAGSAVLLLVLMAWLLLRGRADIAA